MKIDRTNWKTTACGMVAAVAQGLKLAAPEYAPVCDGVTLIATAAMGYFAKDNNVTGGVIKQ